MRHSGEDVAMERADGDQPVLAIDGLVASWEDDEPVLLDAAARFWDGVTVIEGPAGAGKSTLWRAIFGLRPPRVRGSIRFRGEELVGKRGSAVSRLGVAGAPQRPKLFPALAVDEHLRLLDPRVLRPGPWTRERIYATFPELAARRSVAAGKLSGGEQRMLAFVHALVTNPRLLILDEPLQALDPVVAGRTARIIAEVAAAGTSVVVLGRPERVEGLPASYALRLDGGMLVPMPPASRVTAP
jgi:ABC-type branched-subunit amino acid transport system ATPase component